MARDRWRRAFGDLLAVAHHHDLGETLGIPGIKQIFYGLALLVIVMYRPAGVWPWLAGKLGLAERRP